MAPPGWGRRQRGPGPSSSSQRPSQRDFRPVGISGGLDHGVERQGGSEVCSLPAAAAVVLPASIVAAASIAHPASRSASSGTAPGHGQSHPAGIQAEDRGPRPSGHDASVGGPAPGRSAGSSARGGRSTRSPQACAGYATYAVSNERRPAPRRPGHGQRHLHGRIRWPSATMYFSDPTDEDSCYPPVNCSGLFGRGCGAGRPGLGQRPPIVAFTPRCDADGASGIAGAAPLLCLGRVASGASGRYLERGAGGGEWAAGRRGAQRRGGGLPVPGGVRPGRGGRRPHLRRRRPARRTGGSARGLSGTARSAWRSRRQRDGGRPAAALQREQ